ncbi:LOG family protein [Coleofasciculus sp.]|uniref:LOG family protein n=1 Tax=Coleofasciculus sp. TaxID=3100458 RepID=UPI003A171AB7
MTIPTVNFNGSQLLIYCRLCKHNMSRQPQPSTTHRQPNPIIPLEIESLEEFDQYLKDKQSLANIVFQSLDLTAYAETLKKYDLTNTVFLGCRLTPDTLTYILNTGGLVFPPLTFVPYDAYRNRLYSPDELMGDYQLGVTGSYGHTLDGRVYDHYVNNGKDHPASILETLAQRLHDHAITDALEELIDGRKVVAIMGGHSLKRSDPNYIKVALISGELTRRGYLMTSGGGPGAMEATHLGAWFAYRSQAELEDAIQILAAAPIYKPMEQWLDTAFAVKQKYPLQDKNGQYPESLGIPTWLYGHEPPTIFATHIAKLFANSIREEGLLAIAKYGVIYSPGSAGTIQEIFQDACQNHYNSFGVVSPMIFLGEDYWKCKKPVFPLLAQLAAGREYSSLLAITDSVDEVIQQIEKFAVTL